MSEENAGASGASAAGVVSREQRSFNASSPRAWRRIANAGDTGVPVFYRRRARNA
jgi:hypothetical protein